MTKVGLDADLRREAGAVLRLPEGNYINPDDIDIERRYDETMIINMAATPLDSRRAAPHA